MPLGIRALKGLTCPPVALEEPLPASDSLRVLSAMSFLELRDPQ